MQNGHTKSEGNVYLRYRKEAAEEQKDLFSREGAAKRLGISTESLRDYERGVTKTVPADVVLNMSILYKAPELRNHYCRNVCPIGEKYTPQIDTEKLEIDRLTLKLLNEFRKISSVKETLVEIVADGVITDDEQPDLRRVLETLDAISVHTQELRVWVEKHIEMKDD